MTEEQDPRVDGVRTLALFPGPREIGMPVLCLFSENSVSQRHMTMCGMRVGTKYFRDILLPHGPYTDVGGTSRPVFSFDPWACLNETPDTKHKAGTFCCLDGSQVASQG
jgi:hypothetical protein